MKWSRATRVLALWGMSAAAVLAVSGASWASSGPIGIATRHISALGQDPGTITIVTTGSSTGTVTWSWSGLGVGTPIDVFVFPKSSPNDITMLSPEPFGTVTTAGTFSANVTLPPGDTWSNTGVGMEEQAAAVGQLPEVPWAAGLPLLAALPWLWSRRRRTQPA
jgi:hypothetical protein